METNKSPSPVTVLPFGVSYFASIRSPSAIAPIKYGVFCHCPAKADLFLVQFRSRPIAVRKSSGSELVGNRNYIRAANGRPESPISADPTFRNAGQIG
jgi:hypothetical protein